MRGSGGVRWYVGFCVEIGCVKDGDGECGEGGWWESWGEWSEDTSEVSEVHAWPLGEEETDPAAEHVACLASNESFRDWQADFRPTAGKAGTAPADR